MDHLPSSHTFRSISKQQRTHSLESWVVEGAGTASINMQAHSAFHRHTFSIPNPSRRFTSSSPRQPIRPAHLSKILCSALAVTASKTLILGLDSKDGGGAGWLVIAFWAGRVLSEGMNEWAKRSKGKGKEKQMQFSLGPASLYT